MREKQNDLYYSLNRYLNSSIEDETLLLKITLGYKELIKINFNTLKKETVRTTLKTKPLILNRYRQTPFYKTIKKIKSLANRELVPFISYFFMHGSLATLDYEAGFSDLDTYVFIKKDTCVNSKKLKQLRYKLQKAKLLLREIDPNSHHGFLCCSEINLDYYCNAYMPIPVFRNAKILFGHNKIIFHLRDSQTEHRQVFERFSNILLDVKRFGYHSISIFDFKYFISVLLLMPTLYFQAVGLVLYKKNSFKLYKSPLLDRASLIRKNFSGKKLKKLQQLLGENYMEETETLIRLMRRKIKEQEIKNNLFINKPNPVPLSNYEKARSELVDKFKNNKDISAIYEYGSIGSPGISDLDLIIVLHGNLKHSSPKDFIIDSKKFPIAAKLATGTLMIISKKDFANIKFFDGVNLFKLWGENILLNKIDQVSLKSREIASVVDWLPERLSRLVKMLKQPELDIKNCLLYLKSFCYVLERVAQLTRDPYFIGFTKEVLEARSLWLKSSHQDLRYLITRLIYAGYEALNVFTEKFFSHKYKTQAKLSLFAWQEIFFTNNPSEIDPDIAISFSSLEKVIVPVDSRLLPHFLIYSKQTGVLSQQMFKQLKLMSAPEILKIRNNYKKFLKKKMGLANKYAEFLLENNFKSGLYRFGFYFVNKNKR